MQFFRAIYFKKKYVVLGAAVLAAIGLGAHFSAGGRIHFGSADGADKTGITHLLRADRGEKSGSQF
ncbi:MAG: hypothetical protein V8Q36_03745 [Anaerotignum sp.]